MPRGFKLLILFLVLALTTSPASSECCGGAENGCEDIEEGDGDCDSDAQCKDGLKCGEDNCG